MADKIQVCSCTSCTDEANMSINCEWVDADQPELPLDLMDDQIACVECANEANLSVDLEGTE